MKTRLLIVALAANLACASLLHAQQQTGPSGIIGWSQEAALCTKLPGSAASSSNYEIGAVTFTATSYGTIGLACTVPGIANGVSPSGINAFAFSFLDPGGEAGGCTVSAYLVNRTAPADAAGWSSGQSFSDKVWTVDVGAGPALNMSDFYDVDLYLYRPKSAVGVCSPAAYGAYLEEIIF